MTGKTVRIASGQGFWGDDLEAPVRQVQGGDIDYLMLDYLAEVTMSIMQKQRSRDPEAGYARERYIQSLKGRKAIRKAKSTAKYIQENHPALFELERDLLTTLQIRKRRNIFTMSLGSAFLIFVLLRALFRLLQTLSGDE